MYYCLFILREWISESNIEGEAGGCEMHEKSISRNEHNIAATIVI
jgi:hypothetical protein